MPEYEKDHIMRVTKTAVKGLNVFLKAESVDAIMHIDEAETGKKKDRHVVEDGAAKDQSEDLDN
ncbi:hypothetical protein A5886_002275 [Enterococcus sp. 8G7_MSG3316]|uniref:Uncharacterized protein n=1 Tax=Candidatus Enterococcus testudinis TaxID=1834191 RepID=A0A242A8D0_9ENTE|nr:hypothetical protein [Enterococcus sp. 8G7_MSG3316]OTN77179.1 hypothetical protein A5886_002275 [Enterococcus sp. 8G7_MSG3316]